MRYVQRDNVAKALADQDDISFEFEELELNLSGYLNPYVRADVFASVHGTGGEIELEEIFATVTRGLPVQLRFGKYYLNMGKLNTEHVHQWAWLEVAHMNQAFFGDEGAQAVGIQANRLQGIGDTALTLSLNAFRSDLIGGHEEAALGDEDAHGGDEPSDIGYSGRLSVFRELNATNFLEVGGAYLYATPDREHDLKARIAAFDATYKWLPHAFTGVKVRAEAMVSDRDVDDDSTGAVTSITAAGAFASAEIRFRKRWDAGGFFDWTQDAVDDAAETTSYGAFLAFMPAEESVRFSLVYRHTESDLFSGSSDTVTFQVLWSLGPHKPHPF